MTMMMVMVIMMMMMMMMTMRVGESGRDNIHSVVNVIWHVAVKNEFFNE